MAELRQAADGHAAGAAVVPGQRYVQCNAYRPVWRVEDIYRRADSIAHARLVKVDEPTVTKTVSCQALADDALFRPDRIDAVAGGPQPADGRGAVDAGPATAAVATGSAADRSRGPAVGGLKGLWRRLRAAIGGR